MHAWEEWGERCVERFRGMFAFALWDRNRETLFLARDRLGVKPLHYAILPDGMVLFGSELKSMLAHGGMARDIDPLAIEEYFALGYVADPRTIFKAATKAAAGAYASASRRGAAGPRAARILGRALHAGRRAQSDDEACEELVVRLRESVRLRMISEVPLGAFLSGGVDSSAVVALMAGLSAEPGQHLLDRVRRSGVQRVGVRAAGRGPLPHEPPRRARRVRRLRPHRRARVAVRRALCRQLGDPDLPRLPARAAPRDRRRCRATAATRASAAIAAIGCT